VPRPILGDLHEGSNSPGCKLRAWIHSWGENRSHGVRSGLPM
jgi:hypothetical protein